MNKFTKINKRFDYFVCQLAGIIVIFIHSDIWGNIRICMRLRKQNNIANRYKFNDTRIGPHFYSCNIFSYNANNNMLNKIVEISKTYIRYDWVNTVGLYFEEVGRSKHKAMNNRNPKFDKKSFWVLGSFRSAHAISSGKMSSECLLLLIPHSFIRVESLVSIDIYSCVI